MGSISRFVYFLMLCGAFIEGNDANSVKPRLRPNHSPIDNDGKQEPIIRNISIPCPSVKTDNNSIDIDLRQQRHLEQINDSTESTDITTETSTSSAEEPVPSNENHAGSTVLLIVAGIVFLLFILWFEYHFVIEKVQDTKDQALDINNTYDDDILKVSSSLFAFGAKQDLLRSAVTKSTEENIAIFNDSGEPTNGTYCVIYLEPSPLPNSSANGKELERHYEINLRFEKHSDHEKNVNVNNKANGSLNTVELKTKNIENNAHGWTIHGNGTDCHGETFTIRNGYVASSGQACWSEERSQSSIMCNGRFNFYKRTFSGAWVANKNDSKGNFYGGEFVRFYHKSMSVFSNIDMEKYGYKGPNVKRNESRIKKDMQYTKLSEKKSKSEDQDTITTEDSFSIIDVTNEPSIIDYVTNEPSIIDCVDQSQAGSIIDIENYYSCSGGTIPTSYSSFVQNYLVIDENPSNADVSIINCTSDTIEEKNAIDSSPSNESKVNQPHHTKSKPITEQLRIVLEPIDEVESYEPVPVTHVVTSKTLKSDRIGMSREEYDDISTCSGLSASYSSYHMMQDDLDCHKQ